MAVARDVSKQKEFSIYRKPIYHRIDLSFVEYCSVE